MDYVEWLADTMIRVPVEHALDVVNIADRYDPQAIKDRLAMMTPQNARVWYISPQEPHNKTAYFVNAPYQVDKISAQTFSDWQQKASAIDLKLPVLNPYIPDDFTLIKSDKAYPHPQLIVDEPTRGWSMRPVSSSPASQRLTFLWCCVIRRPWTALVAGHVRAE